MRRHYVIGLIPLLLAASACADDSGPVEPARSLRTPGGALALVGPSPMGSPVAVGVATIADGFVSPVQLVHAPGNNGRRFVVDQVGMIWGLTPSGNRMPEPFLDVSDRIVELRAQGDERGLLGLAFHPDFARNNRFFVFYNAPPRAGAPAGFNNTIVISEFRTQGAQQIHADASSERIVLQVHHPQANHNGGTIAFGPDGYLYISIGDGGNRDDEGLGHVDDWYIENAGGNGQDITQNLLGNILRIDVDGGTPYGIPADNPFVGKAGLDEIYAYGLRNPYRMAYDPGGSHIRLSMDAGQELWEEVSVIEKGGNYGWNVKEGTHCFDAENPTVSPATCPSVDPTTNILLTDPVIEFANAKQPGGLAFTVVGGNVYRGSDVPALFGRYIFGGATSTVGRGRMFVSTPQGNNTLWSMQELLVNGTDRLDYFIKGFGQDRDGEVYVMATQELGPVGTTGTIFKLTTPNAP
jgi:glucose/arabinose dehydrogenase